jgi:hypothetical protein
MEHFLETIKNFEPISLSEMDNVKLLNRTDLKFVFHKDKLATILLSAQEFYRALVISNRLYTDYETNYFDTENFKFYLDHHNKRSNRFKVRMRSYVNSGLHFFEIKHKNNKNRTIKIRIKIENQTDTILRNCAELLENCTGILPQFLHRTIQINCKRITLVNKELTERVTIDFDLSYLLNHKEYPYPEMVIIEIKQDKTRKSDFLRILKQQHLRKMSLSKYSFGIANYIEGIKKNNFKNQIHYVNKISNEVIH